MPKLRIANKRFRTGGKVAAKGKLAAAVALGKRGGKKGGPARAKALTSEKRKSIASHAAKRRWGKATNYTKPPFYKRKVR
jgi:hypothetical protein